MLWVIPTGLERGFAAATTADPCMQPVQEEPLLHCAEWKQLNIEGEPILCACLHLCELLICGDGNYISGFLGQGLGMETDYTDTQTFLESWKFSASRLGDGSVTHLANVIDLYN